MIKNEKQYRITRDQADRFSQTLNKLKKGANDAGKIHPLIAKAQEEALESQLTDLEAELREYESLKAGGFNWDELNVVGELAGVLIKARISQGLSQKDLAVRIGLRIGLKEQQIQRYEATDYESASLRRIKQIANALTIGGPGYLDDTNTRQQDLARHSLPALDA